MSRMKELEDLKKKHKLKDDFLEPKSVKKYGNKGKSEPLLGKKKGPKEVQEKSIYDKLFGFLNTVEVEDKRVYFALHSKGKSFYQDIKIQLYSVRIS